MPDFLSTEALFIELLLVAALVAIVVRRLRLPYTVALVIVGLMIAAYQPFPLEVTPELILALFLPPLIFEAAFHLDFSSLRANLIAILILAVPGVLLTMLIVGGLVSLGAGIPLATALVFGALIAATDPVAVIAAFRTSGVTKRLAVALEGESLFNDGTAIVLYNLALVAALSGSFSAGHSLLDFAVVSLGGLAVGGILGWIITRIIAFIDDYLIETTLTTILAYGAYLAAERLGVSGVLAVVVAGVISRNLGAKGMSPTTKFVLFNFWEYIAFLANSLIFLLIGLEVNLSSMLNYIGPIAAAVGGVLIARAVISYGLTWLANGLGAYFPNAWRHVFFWGGLRGAIGLALALSLPINLPGREMLRVMAFGVVLFTILLQGTTIKFLVDRLGLADRPERIDQQERNWARLYASRAGLKRLMELHHEGFILGDVWEGLKEEYAEIDYDLDKDLRELYKEYPEMEQELVLRARQEALLAERASLGDALRRGFITDQLYRGLIEELDRRMEALNIIAEHKPKEGTEAQGNEA